MEKLVLCCGILFGLSGCSDGEDLRVSAVDYNKVEILEEDKKNILLIAGEGGPSGNMFVKAARTYQKKDGGEIYEVHDGDEFIAAVRNFLLSHEKIDHLEYFGHGNEIGLYVNQEANVNGGLYANDPLSNKDYRAASIYELPSDIFARHGWVKFNGCNVAKGFPDENSLAQSVANFFGVDVFAPLGPTEFSSNPYLVAPIEGANYLDPDFDGDVYMVSTYGDKDFVVVEPQETGGGVFSDVRKGQVYEEAVNGLLELGLDLGITGGIFEPYKNVRYAEALKFCLVFTGDVSKCSNDFVSDKLWIRNLDALKMLVDASGVKLKKTVPWYDSYVWWAKNEGLLTKDFTNRKWYTRGEMAELTWNFTGKFQVK